MSHRSVKEIPLTQGRFALVDASDYAWLSRFKWYYGGKGYAVRKERVAEKQRMVCMQNALLNPLNGFVVDHINGDPLDNRRCNLRIATQAENNKNLGLGKRSKSGCLGVYQQGGRWYARIRANGKWVYLGGHSTRAEAVAARLKGEVLFCGEFAPHGGIRR